MQMKLMFMVFLLMFPGVYADDEADDANEIGAALIDGITGLISGVFDMVEDYIIEPGMRIFKNTFGGIADALGAVIGGTFSGVNGFMNSAWKTSTNAIKDIPYIGPFAPILAFAVLAGVVYMFWFLFVDKIADDLVPLPGEDDMED